MEIIGKLIGYIIAAPFLLLGAVLGLLARIMDMTVAGLSSQRTKNQIKQLESKVGPAPTPTASNTLYDKAPE